MLFKFIMSIYFKLTNKPVHGKVQLSLFLVRAQPKELSQSLFLSTRLIVRLLNPFADLPVRDVQWAQGKPTLTACLSGALCSMDGSTYLFFWHFHVAFSKSFSPLFCHYICLLYDFFSSVQIQIFSLLDARSLFPLGSWPLVYSAVIWVVGLLVTSHICLTSDLSC